VIRENIIDLNENNIFTHPATGKVFEVMNEKERFKFKRKIQPLY